MRLLHPQRVRRRFGTESAIRFIRRREAELAKHGLKCDGKRAIQLQKNDYGKYDLFIGMDSANIRNMLYIFGNDPDRKIHKLMNYTSRGGDVADPWYSRNFEVTYKDVLEGCTALLDELIDKNE